MLVEIREGLWLNPYEIVEIYAREIGTDNQPALTVEYRCSQHLITRKEYYFDTIDEAMSEAKRVAELVNKFYEPSPSWSPSVELITDRVSLSHGTLSEAWTNEQVVQFVLDAKKEVEEHEMP